MFWANCFHTFKFHRLSLLKGKWEIGVLLVCSIVPAASANIKPNKFICNYHCINNREESCEGTKGVFYRQKTCDTETHMRRGTHAQASERGAGGRGTCTHSLFGFHFSRENLEFQIRFHFSGFLQRAPREHILGSYQAFLAFISLARVLALTPAFFLLLNPSESTPGFGDQGFQ